MSILEVAEQSVPFVLNLNAKFRNTQIRTGALISGSSGWGEFAPFPEYSDEVSAKWLAGALEAAFGTYPAKLRNSIPVNSIIPILDVARTISAVESAIKDVPSDWDMIFPGSCCLGGRIKSTIRIGLVEAWPLCTHCYIVRKKALKTLIETNEEQYGPIDVQLYFKSFQNMKIYAIDPRVADQFDTLIV